MAIPHIERFENAKSYIYLKRTTLFGGGYIILIETGDERCCKFVSYWTDNVAGPTEVVLFDDFIDCCQFKRSVDSLDCDQFLSYKPSEFSGHSNYSDFVMTRSPNGVERFYSVAGFPVDEEHESLLSILSRFDTDTNILPRLQGYSPLIVGGSLA